jgi:NADPH-dependent 2,4-dienoyl-CoA reductase/sulfur reductase-like enzyme
VFAEIDVLVVGGGPAGIAAAIAGARLGAEVLLVERYNHLGGLSAGGPSSGSTALILLSGDNGGASRNKIRSAGFPWM